MQNNMNNKNTARRHASASGGSGLASSGEGTATNNNAEVRLFPAVARHSSNSNINPLATLAALVKKDGSASSSGSHGLCSRGASGGGRTSIRTGFELSESARNIHSVAPAPPETQLPLSFSTLRNHVALLHTQQQQQRENGDDTSLWQTSSSFLLLQTRTKLDSSVAKWVDMIPQQLSPVPEIEIGQSSGIDFDDETTDTL